MLAKLAIASCAYKIPVRMQTVLLSNLSSFAAGYGRNSIARYVGLMHSMLLFEICKIILVETHIFPYTLIYLSPNSFKTKFFAKIL